MSDEDPVPGGVAGNLIDISSRIKPIPGSVSVPAHSKLFGHIHDLGEWAYANESALVDALKLVINRLPYSEISKYERALDALPKGENVGPGIA